MKLYYSKGACSFAPRIIFNELELKGEFEAVDLATKKTETGQNFTSINPKGAVPTLITDDGETLTENAVILQYLADKSEAVSLLPAFGSFKRYRVLEWLNYVATELHKGFGPLFNSNVPQADKDKIFIPLLKNKFTFLNKHLEENVYLTGETFTLPDAYLFVVLRWAVYLKFDLNEWPHLTRYFKNLQTRKSIQKSMSEEGLRAEVSV